jgi:hypothetical protein
MLASLDQTTLTRLPEKWLTVLGKADRVKRYEGAYMSRKTWRWAF